MPSKETMPPIIRIHFAEQPQAVREIIGDRAIRTAKWKQWSLQDVRRVQKSNALPGGYTPKGKPAPGEKTEVAVISGGKTRQALRFHSMNIRRQRRAMEKLESDGFFERKFPADIAKTYPIVSWAPNGDLILRRLTRGKAAAMERGIRLGTKGFVLLEIDQPRQLARARAIQARRTTRRIALARDIRANKQTMAEWERERAQRAGQRGPGIGQRTLDSIRNPRRTRLR
ncbi:MAG: hypothetical protein NT067_06830 [Candidatus Diapherotrites archaeon]|nr:hypothetical protein [Candidatus Diapherotrites archaeon]